MNIIYYFSLKYIVKKHMYISIKGGVYFLKVKNEYKVYV